MYLDALLTIASREGKTQGTRIFQVSGPITLSNLFTFQDALRTGELPRRAILDMKHVPYLDSAGMGAIVNYYVHCQRCGARMMVAGVNSRPLELFVLTKVNTIIPMWATVEEAEASS